MSWFTTEGKHPHHVIFSKTTFVRNLSGMPFTKKMGDKSIESFFKKSRRPTDQKRISRRDLERKRPHLSPLLSRKGVY